MNCVESKSSVEFDPSKQIIRIAFWRDSICHKSYHHKQNDKFDSYGIKLTIMKIACIKSTGNINFCINDIILWLHGLARKQIDRGFDGGLPLDIITFLVFNNSTAFITEWSW